MMRLIRNYAHSHDLTANKGRALLAALVLALPACPGGGDGGDSEGPDASTSSGPTSDPGPMDPGTSSGTTDPGDDPSGAPTSTGTTTGEPTTGDPSGEPPVEECHLADDNVACGAKVEGRGLVSRASGPTPSLPPPAQLKVATTPVAVGEPCDIYAQDCPEGQKCNVHGPTWHEVGCFPLDPAPQKVGEPCWGQTDGIDNCEAGAVCQFEALEQTMICKPLCGCSEETPTCGENERCVVYNGGALPMCERLCNPLDLSSCEPGEVCVKSGWFADFFCEMDVSGDAGIFRDQCKSVNDCDPGYSCEYADYVPGGCPEGVETCCTPLCLLDDPLCPQGAVCLEYFGGFGLEAPQCLENVGYCAAPL